MFDKLIALLERFVIAHEKIAASVVADTPEAVDVETPTAAAKKGKSAAKKEPEPPAVDVAALREEIKSIAKAIAAGDDDDCADGFDDLLADFDVRNVTKLEDADVPDFYEKAKKLVTKYYEIEE
jgi:hypothetical protein